MIASRIARYFLLPLFALPVADSPDNADNNRQRLRTLEAMWDDCREIWFQGREHLTRQERVELFNSFTSDRDLTPKQKDCILRMGDVLIDKEWDRFRDGAARWLGNMGHAYCIPPLLAVLNDEDENSGLRVDCVMALSHIADKRVADSLIDALTDNDWSVALNANDRLILILGFDRCDSTLVSHPGLPPLGGFCRDLEWRKQIQKKYRQWWKKHRDRVKLNRSATFMSG